MKCVRMRLTVLLVTVGLAVAACSEPSSRADAAGQAASAFTVAATTRAGAACAMLAPQTRRELVESSGPCAQALPELGLPEAGRVLEVDVYGLDARVRLEHDTVFLALFDTGWRITAAGCTPTDADRPYSCEIKGT